MRRVLELLIESLAKNGCEVIYADLTRVVFSSQKQPEEWDPFWESLKETLLQHDNFKTCLCFDESCLTRMFFGMLWIDRANNAGIEIKGDTASWRPDMNATVLYDLQRAEALPPAVRTAFYSYVSDWVQKPMRQVAREFAEPSDTSLSERERLRKWMVKEYIPSFRAKLFRVLQKLEDVQEAEKERAEEPDTPASEAEALRLRWEVPSVPVVIEANSENVMLSFVKLLVEVLRQEKEEELRKEVRSLRRDLLSLICEKEFDPHTEFRSSLHAVELSVRCTGCKTVEVIDVTTHEHRAPGVFACRCGELYSKNYVQARLVERVDALVATWQAQDLLCMKCGRTKHDLVEGLCSCAGRYQTTLSKEDARNALLAMQSVAEPHDLPDLEEVTATYLALF
jgi:DNA polymerase epsilon subunit 1